MNASFRKVDESTITMDLECPEDIDDVDVHYEGKRLSVTVGLQPKEPSDTHIISLKVVPGMSRRTLMSIQVVKSTSVRELYNTLREKKGWDDFLLIWNGDMLGCDVTQSLDSYGIQDGNTIHVLFNVKHCSIL